MMRLPLRIETLDQALDLVDGTAIDHAAYEADPDGGFRLLPDVAQWQDERLAHLATLDAKISRQEAELTAARVDGALDAALRPLVQRRMVAAVKAMLRDEWRFEVLAGNPSVVQVLTPHGSGSVDAAVAAWAASGDGAAYLATAPRQTPGRLSLAMAALKTMH